jgi:hypothetical protein
VLSFSPVLLSPAPDSHTPAKAVSQKLYISHSAPPSQPCTNNAGCFPSIRYRKVGRGAPSQCISAKAACMSSAGIHMTSHSSRHNPTFGRRRMRSRYRGGACIRVCKFFFPFLSLRSLFNIAHRRFVRCNGTAEQNHWASRGKVPGYFDISLYPFRIQPLSRSTFQPTALPRFAHANHSAGTSRPLHWPGSVPGCREFEALMF